MPLSSFHRRPVVAWLCLLPAAIPVPVLGQNLLGPGAAQPAEKTADTRPDLSVGRLSLSRAVAHLGETVEAEVTIDNTGSVGVRNVTVRFFLGGKQIGRDYLVDVGPNGRVDVSTEFRAEPQGKQEFLVQLDPDNAVTEQRERNNTASRTLGILSLPSALSHIETPRADTEPAPAGATPPSTAAPAPAAPRTAPPATPPAAAKAAPGAEPANLVAQIETIEGLHYFNGREIKVKVTNHGRGGRAAPSMLGLRAARKGAPLLTRLPVAGLDAGKSVTVALPWPDGQPSGADGPDYVVLIDVDNDVSEGPGENDNLSNLFRPVSVAAAATADQAEPASLKLLGPPVAEPLRPGQTYDVTWEHHGAVGDKIKLVVIGSKSRKETSLVTIDNSGTYAWTVPALGEPAFWLALRSADGKTEGRQGPYQLAPTPGGSLTVEWPRRGEALYAGNDYSLRWNGAYAGKLQLRLLEKGSETAAAVLKDVEVDAAAGRYSWSLPEESMLFGEYRLRLVDAGGRQLAESEPFEINPAFVFPRAPQDDPAAAEKLTADLAVTDAGFKQGRFNFSIKNLGPDTIPFHVVSGLRMRTYFIKRTPIRNSTDYQVCDRRLYAPFEAGKTYDFELGREPGCRFGNQNEAERFEYAVVRLEIPSIHDASIRDKDYLNNGLKFYYPR